MYHWTLVLWHDQVGGTLLCECFLNVECRRSGFPWFQKDALVCTPRAGTKIELLDQNSMQNHLAKHSKPISHGEVAGRSVKMMDFERILSNT